MQKRVFKSNKSQCKRPSSSDPRQINAHVARTYQCNLRVWRKAESPSINSRMVTVRTAHGAKTPSCFSPVANTMCHNTSDSSTAQETIEYPTSTTAQFHWLSHFVGGKQLCVIIIQFAHLSNIMSSLVVHSSGVQCERVSL